MEKSSMARRARCAKEGKLNHSKLYHNEKGELMTKELIDTFFGMVRISSESGADDKAGIAELLEAIRGAE